MSNTKQIPFNLNDKIRVRLADKGRSHLRKLHNAVSLGTSPYSPPNEIDGWAEFHLWDFIGKFGEFCQTPGLDLPFSPGIELVVEDNDSACAYLSRMALEIEAWEKVKAEFDSKKSIELDALKSKFLKGLS